MNENVNKKVKTEGKNNKRIIINIIVFLILIAAITTGIIITRSNIISTKNPVGKYNLIQMSENGEEYSKEDIEMLKSFGLTISLELKKDKTGILEMFGETMELTYNEESFIIEDDVIPYTYEDNMISLEKDGTKLILEKVVDEK